MFYLLLFCFSIHLIEIDSTQDQQIVHIRIDEELPLSTILFTTTTNAVTYRLFDTGRNQNSFVQYDASNGRLLLARSLDRELLCVQHICSCSPQCQLTIELIEWQSPYRLLQLILNVDDINDHLPTFSSRYFNFTIQENVPLGFELPLEQAYDADLGENSRIGYELKPMEGPFELVTKSNSLVLRVIKEIDREERDEYDYQLIAFDHGQPRRESSTRLHIQIEDMNDNPVDLAETHIRVNVSESAPVGTELTRVIATDKDIGLNGKIHYSISSGLPSSSWMDYFRIGDSTGILTLVAPLDYESEQSYRLTIQVRDWGENSIARFATIDITVLDENDNRPQAFVTFVDPLINASTIYLRENTPVGQSIAHVALSDRDSGVNGEMTYRIERGEELIGIKPIDRRSFWLIVKRLIDRENGDNKPEKFILSISDHGRPAKILRLEYTIVIVDENDCTPIFDPTINCNVQIDRWENRSTEDNQPLFQVHATDLDSGDNGRVSYSILPPYESSFTITDDGQVFISQNLNESSSYHLRIMAIDHGHSNRLNSTRDCFISTMTTTINNHPDYPSIANVNTSIASPSLIPSKMFFDWSSSLFSRYSYLFIAIFIVFLLLIIVIVTVCLTICLHTLIVNNRQRTKQKQYQCTRPFHLYDTASRKSPYLNDESGCSSKTDDNDDVHSEERERLVTLNSDQTSCESSDSMHKQIRIVNKNSMLRPLSNQQNFHRTVRNSYPPSPYLSSMSSVVIPPPKPPRDSGYESSSLLKQQPIVVAGRPLSLSISTATTYTTSGTDSSSSPVPPPSMNTFRPPYSSFKFYTPMSTVVRLAEEEKIDV